MSGSDQQKEIDQQWELNKNIDRISETYGSAGGFANPYAIDVPGLPARLNP